MSERVFRVKWYHTEEFEMDIGLDERDMEEVADADEDDQEGVLQEKLMDAIIDMDQEALTSAFQGCTEREITETEELDG